MHALGAMEFAADSVGFAETTTSNASITHLFDEVGYSTKVTVMLEIVESN